MHKIAISAWSNYPCLWVEPCELLLGLVIKETPKMSQGSFQLQTDKTIKDWGNFFRTEVAMVYMINELGPRLFLAITLTSC